MCERHGSSPLARGTFLTGLLLTLGTRLIPARAGNMAARRARAPGLAAHPRSRGEHDDGTRRMRGLGGSSPLARGTLAVLYGFAFQERLIPARAGNITCRKRARKAPAAHPRSRGEHASIIPCPSCSGGSSPLARGTLMSIHRHIIRLRLIPARAGNMQR